MQTAPSSGSRAGRRRKVCRLWGTLPLHPVRKRKVTRAGLEPDTAANGTFYLLAPAYPCGFPSLCCHFACVTQTVSLIITQGRRSCKQVYDIHGLLHLCYILRACKQHLVALSDKLNISLFRAWKGALGPPRGAPVTQCLGC